MSQPSRMLAVDRSNVADVLRTSFGWCGFRWDDDRLAGIVVGYLSPVEAARALWSSGDQDIAIRGEFASEKAAVRANLPAAAGDLYVAFARYAEGERIDFPTVELAWIPKAAFTSSVLDVCRAIPYGAVRSYGEVAQLAGSPRASRAVGNAMRTNRYPILIPCHRVIAAQGKLGGYSSPRGLDFKRRLLAMEAG